MQIVKTLLADNHRIFLEGLKTVLKSDPHHQHHIVGCTPNGKKLVELWREHLPELLIMDLNLVEQHGLEAIEEIRREGSDRTCILVMTAYQDTKILRAVMENGANGYLPKYKGAVDLYEAIDSVLHGIIYRSEPLKSNMGKLLTDTNGQPAVIAEVFVKKHRLTKRETQILSLISQAMNNKEIGRKLFISDQTVSVHRKNIMRKLGVRSTAGLIKMAYDHCL
ncbi:LuxR C-terminal-related transcriptional regulator [Flavilitoribacter nigricans]|nr:response regulator transcription factor [Flavilitoribacter nigricans]